MHLGLVKLLITLSNSDFLLIILFAKPNKILEISNLLSLLNFLVNPSNFFMVSYFEFVRIIYFNKVFIGSF